MTPAAAPVYRSPTSAFTGHVGLVVVRGRDALVTRAAGSARLRTWSLRVPIIAAAAVVLGGGLASVLAAGQVLAP